MISPGVEPESTPKPGADKRAAAAFTNLSRPATYPPQGASVPPGFFIKLPAIKSAPFQPLLIEILFFSRKKELEITYHCWRFSGFHKFSITVIHHHQAIRVLHLKILANVFYSLDKSLLVQRKREEI